MYLGSAGSGTLQRTKSKRSVASSTSFLRSGLSSRSMMILSYGTGSLVGQVGAGRVRLVHDEHVRHHHELVPGHVLSYWRLALHNF